MYRDEPEYYFQEVYITHEDLLKKFTDFAYLQLDLLKPEDALEIAPGMETYKESYELDFFKKRKQLQFEMAYFVDELIKDADSSVNRLKLNTELLEVGENAFKEFTHRYWKRAKR